MLGYALMRDMSGSQFSSLRFGIFGSLALLVVYIGCSSNNPNQAAGVGGSGPAVTGAGAGSTCQNGVADGYCIAEGPAAEDCTCEDCAIRAVCNDGCTDDGNCTREQDGSTEDCTCADCFNKVNGCAPSDNGCDEEPGCQTNEACTCPDCNNDDYCQSNCVDNGQCVPATEGCSCADCSNHEYCGGGPGPGPGPGAGGNGGSTSNGGAGGTSSAGGSGGTPGVGGAGGAGGT